MEEGGNGAVVVELLVQSGSGRAGDCTFTRSLLAAWGRPETRAACGGDTNTFTCRRASARNARKARCIEELRVLVAVPAAEQRQLSTADQQMVKLQDDASRAGSS